MDAYNNLDAEINAEIEECERLEEQARTEAAREEAREISDVVYDEWARIATKTGVLGTGRQWARVATKTGVPLTYRTGA